MAATTWNLADRPAAAASVWRAAPPLNLYNPSEPLAGNWRTWALEDSKEISPPHPVPFGSERYSNEAQEVLRVSRALTPEQKRMADEWNLDKGSVPLASDRPSEGPTSSNLVGRGCRLTQDRPAPKIAEFLCQGVV